MDEKPDQIIGHIEAQRHELGRNLNELETRVRASTNWRTYYEKNPMLAVGAALGGGLLLGTMVSSSARHSTSSHRVSSSSSRSLEKRTSSAASSAPAASMVSNPVTSMQRRHITESIDHVKAALIAFGIAKAKEFINQAIPGLEPHLTEAEQRGRQHSSGAGASQWQPGTSSQERQSGVSHSWESAGASAHEPVPAV